MSKPTRRRRKRRTPARLRTCLKALEREWLPIVAGRSVFLIDRTGAMKRLIPEKDTHHVEIPT